MAFASILSFVGALTEPLRGTIAGYSTTTAAPLGNASSSLRITQSHAAHPGARSESSVHADEAESVD